MEARLQTRIAPLRARRLHKGGNRYPWRRGAIRAAGVFLLIGLSAWSVGLYRKNGLLDMQLGQLTRDVADLRFAMGDIHAAARMYRTPAVIAQRTADPVLDRRLTALDRLEGDERPLRLWSQARRAVGNSQRRLLSQICGEFPDHWLADEAFVLLEKATGRNLLRLRPLDVVAEGPLTPITSPPAGSEPQEHFRTLITQLRQYATASESEGADFALFRAAQIADTELGVADAVEGYTYLLEKVDSGRIRDLALARLKTLTSASGARQDP